MKKRHLLLVFTGMVFLGACTDENTPGGSNPPADDRSRFAGTWTCAEDNGQTFSVGISIQGTEDSIYINNFSNYGATANALGFVSGNSLTIPAQNISITAVPVQGSGVMNSAGTKITMTYMADGTSINATCTKN